ncbi:MAG: hypothetical protein A2Y82_02280 [Candidatus Buchananbacteria bacterium RBG_13_36_9]|uniref:Uncharacterized protein n=1 Tax=Candidatus Buchananbacteria bacterium RBG_13_36_9 TaxID=1797530 RepID=A0A1G1XQ17_9BACT|nr:MAG: hypothetical protein A2Y82_02280 [Candidatus Buchananbacteria bacterium RBG_13_36_9]
MREKRRKYKTKSNQYKKPGKRKKKKIKRVCLRCQKEFMSEGVFNKICPNCRTLNENVSPLALPENFPLHQPEK